MCHENNYSICIYSNTSLSHSFAYLFYYLRMNEKEALYARVIVTWFRRLWAGKFKSNSNINDKLISVKNSVPLLSFFLFICSCCSHNILAQLQNIRYSLNISLHLKETLKYKYYLPLKYKETVSTLLGYMGSEQMGHFQGRWPSKFLDTETQEWHVRCSLSSPHYTYTSITKNEVEQWYTRIK